MYKLKINISQPANYIYHMLSVSKVGYNNNYGRRYERFHSFEDLNILKMNEKQLTVSGGEYCGALYTLLVAKPASASNLISLKRYFESIMDLFLNKDYERTARHFSDLENEFLDIGVQSYEDAYFMCLKVFLNYADEILLVSEVMLKNIKVYEDNIWEIEQKYLLEYKYKLSKSLELKQNIVLKWEAQLNTRLSIDNFEIILVNSIEDGAQAIDISETKDVFNANLDVKNLVGLISHEIGIYILFQSIPISMKGQMAKYWLCIESLATYHNQRVLFEDENLFAKRNPYFSKFDEIYKSDKYRPVVDVIEFAVN